MSSVDTNTAASSPWRAWWASLGKRGGVARGDIAGGLTAALVLPAIEGSYGLVAFGGLGADMAQTGFLLGAYTAGIATIVTLLAGGRGPMLSGSSAALALLLASLLGWLITDPRFVGADGRPFLPMLLAFSGLGLVLAGLMQVVVARLKLGVLVRYVPYPVHAGYMNGVAVLMIAAVFTHLLGIPSGSELEVLRTRPLALLVALTALWFALRAPKWTRRIPPYLTGLLAAAALHHLLALTPWAGALGPQFEPPQFQWPSLEVLAPVADNFNSSLLADKIGMLLLFALAVAMMSTLQTALAGSTLDELTHKRRDSERELLAQGVANVAVGAIGALPSAGSTTRGKINIDAGGATAVSRLVFGMALLLALAYGLQFMSLLPMAAIAGVFVAVAFSLVDDWTRRATAVLTRQTLKRRVPRALAQNYAVMLLVAGVTIFVSLALAIALGTFVAMVQFIRSNCKRPVRQVVYADRRSSRKVRPVEQTELLRQHGRRIAVVELDGALFFGTAEAADEEIEHLARASEFIIIDFERVGEVDASGARVLLHAADSVERAGKLLLLAGLTAHDARTRIILDMDVHGRLDQAQFFPDTDRALEFAEDRLLADVAPQRGADSALTLGATLMGRGLSEQEIALLAPLLTERRFARGEAVFRRGEPGDAMYVSLHGQIGIWLPADEGGGGARGRRMVTYAPGVVFGEIGLMQNRPRSADAIAEEEAVVLELTRAHYDELGRSHPALLGKLLLNIGLLLASRVRALTDELEAAQAAR
jgi:SulP family sulfate permease